MNWKEYMLTFGVIIAFMGVLLIIVFLWIAPLAHAQISVNTTEISKTASVMSYGFFDPIRIYNGFNESAAINITYSGNTKFIQMVNSTTIPPNSTQEVYIPFFVPLNVPAGAYSTNMGFEYNSTLTNITLILNVFDNIAPIIEKCEVAPASNNRSKPVSVTCRITDNINISTVKMAVGRNLLVKEISMTDIGNNNYQGNFTGDAAGIYNVTVTANDVSGNFKDYDTLRFVLTEWSPLDAWDGDFLRIKYNQSHRIGIAYISDQASINISAGNFAFESGLNGNIDFNIILPDGRHVTSGYFSDVPRGNVYFEVYSMSMGDFSGDVRFFSEGYEKISHISGNFSWYTVPQVLDTEWYGNKVHCYSIDTGVFQNSSRVCEIKMPLDTDISQGVTLVPISLANSVNLTMMIEKDRKLAAVQSWRSVFLIWAVLATLGGAGYYVKENW